MSYLNTFTSPRFKTSFILVQSGGNYTVQANNPAAARTLTIIDPGGADSFVFAAATQNLSNKTLASDLAFGGFKGTGAGTPTASGDLATKGYVDSIAQGLHIKPTADAATTAALPACTYANGASGVGATLTGNSNGALAAQDGVTLILNDYLLVKDQAADLQNGLYKLTQVGDGSNPFILTRAVEMDTSSDFEGAYVPVDSGTTNARTAFVCTNSTAPTVGTTAITFGQFQSAAVLTEGNGINVSGSTISVDAGSGLTFSGATLVVDTSVVLTQTNSMTGITNKTFSTGCVWNGGTIGDSYLTESYLKADGSRALSANWAAGAFSITANSIVIGGAAYRINGSDNATVDGNAVTATVIRGGNKTGAAGTSGAGGQLSLIGGSATGGSSTGAGGDVLLAGGTTVGGAAGTVNIGDAADNTKRVGFAINGATTAKKATLSFSHTDNRTITFFDASDTVVGRATTDTLTNKTITNPIINHSVAAVSSNTTMTASSAEVQNVTTGSSTIAMTLPAANGVAAGRRFTFRKVDSGSGKITITPAGSDTLGLFSADIDLQNDTITVESDGTSKWWGV